VPLSIKQAALLLTYEGIMKHYGEHADLIKMLLKPYKKK